MKNYDTDLTNGPLAKGILLYSIPLVFSNLLQVLFNTADIAVVGKFAGTIPLGSVGSTTQLLFFFTGMLMGLGGGINVIVAYYIGAKSKKDITDAVNTSAIISLIVGILLMVFGIAISRPVLVLIKTKPELLEGAITYFRIYMLGMPGVALFNFGNAVLSAAGDTKRPLFYLSISGVINIILNLFFVIVCHMEAGGVALASVISQYISAILVFFPLMKGIGDIKFRFRHLRVNREKMIQIFKIGLPSGLQNGIFAFANTFIQVGVNSFDPIMVAGTAASSNLDPIIYNVMAALYTACASYIGQNYGAGKKKRILHTYLLTTAYAFGIGLGFGIVFYVFGHQILSLFTSDPAVIDAALIRQNVMVCSFCVSAFMDNSIAASRGLGKTLVPSIIVFLGSCVFRIVWIYTVFAYFQTVPSLFSLYLASWALTGFFEIIYFVKTYKKVVDGTDQLLTASK